MPTQARICTHSCMYLRACFLTKCRAFAPSPSRMHPWFQHTHTHTHIRTHVYTHRQVCIRTHTGKCVYTHTQASVYTHINWQVFIHIHAHLRAFLSSRTCMQACIHDLTPTHKHPQTHRYIDRQIHARIQLGKQTYYRLANG